MEVKFHPIEIPLKGLKYIVREKKKMLLLSLVCPDSVVVRTLPQIN